MNKLLYKLLLPLFVFLFQGISNAQTDTVYLTFVSTNIDCGQTKGVKMQVKNFKNVVTLNFTMRYNKSIVKFNSFSGLSTAAQSIANETNYSDISAGNTFSWDGKGTGVTLPDGDAFDFLFSPVAESGGLTDTLKFSSMPTTIKVEIQTASGKKNAIVKTSNAFVTIVDKFSPVLKCPDFKFVKIGATEDSTSVNELNPSVSDPLCGKAFVDYTLTGATIGMGLDQDATGKTFNLGLTNVRYLAHDNADNTAECQFQVLVSKTDSILLYTTEPLVRCSDSTFTVEMRVANFKDITGFDMEVYFPKSIVQLKSIQQINSIINSSNPNFVSGTSANQGLVKVSFITALGITLPDNSVLYSLTFRKINGTDKVILDHQNIEAATITSGNNKVPVSILSNPITIIDTEEPVLKCPKDTSVYLTTLNQNSVQVFGINAIATDNCGVQILNYTGTGATTIPSTFNINGKIFNIGKTTILANAKDFANKIAVCEYNVYVRQPRVTTSDEIVDCKADTVGFTLNVADFIDIKKLTTRLQWNVDSLEYLYTTYTNPFLQGTNISHNALGNNVLIDFNTTQTNGLTVADNQAMAKVYFKIKDKTLGKKYKIITQVSNIEVGTNNTVVYGTGVNGHVSILDTKGPNIINCPSDITIRQDKCIATHSWTIPTATDDCSTTVTLDDTNAPNNGKATIEANIKPTVFYYTFKDQYNNKTTCTFKVTVLDTIKPIFTNCDTSTITLPTNDLLPNCSAILDDPYLPARNEECDYKITTNLSVGDTIRKGAPINYIISISDLSGNTATCARKIVVRDATGPKFNGNFFNPNLRTLYSEQDKCGTTYIWTPPTATDNCDGTVNVTSDVVNGAFFPVGTTKVNFSAFDTSNNKTADFITVLVLDTIPPKFLDCPNNNKDTTIYITTGCDVVVNTPVVLYTDNCSNGIQTATLQTVEPAGKRYPIGKTTLEYLTASPSALCFVNVIVIDTIKPTITCPKDTVLDANNLCTANFILPNPTLSDNCGVPIFTPSTTQIQFTKGITAITYTARDASNNTATCAFSINVKDNTPPVIVDCPTDITTDTDSGVDYAYPSWSYPSVTDNCTDTDSIDIATTHLNGSTKFKIGTTTVTYTATDKSGNTSTCSFKVTVLDNEKPIIKGCPSSSDTIFKIFGPTCDARFSLLETLKRSDNHRIASIDSTGTNANIRYKKGSYNFSLTAKDSSGNESVCSFRLTFIDRQAPTASNCKPTQGPFNAPTGSCEAQLQLSDITFPTFADNCDATVTTIDTVYKQNGIWKKGLPVDLKFNVGQTQLGIVAKDSANNISDTCFINIVVNGTLKPSLSGCQKDTTVYVSTGCSQKMTFKVPTYTAGCVAIDTANSYYNYPDGYEFAISKNPYKVSYYLVDKNGAADTCTFSLTVLDTIKPILSVTKNNVAIDTIEIFSKNCAAILLPSDAFKIDAEDLPCANNIAKIDTSINLSNAFNIGTTAVTFTATDIFGKKSSKILYVNVIDTISNNVPKVKLTPNSAIYCPGDTVKLSVDSLIGFVATWKSKNGETKTGNSIKLTAADEYTVSYVSGTCSSKTSNVTITYVPTFSIVKDSITLNTNSKDSSNIIRNDGNSNVIVTWNTNNFTANIGTITTKSNGDFVVTTKNITGTFKIPYKVCSIDCPDLCVSDSLIVKINGTTPTDCKVPNLVTPNGDSFNDNLVIDCISNATTGAKIYIYSQWGELVFSSVDYRNDWDGTWKGKPLPDGTYFYVFQLNSSAEEKKGFITIFR